MHLTATFFLALAIAAPAIAADSTPAPAASPQRKICRTEAPTGSIMPKRACHTEEEWRQIDDHYHVNVDNLNNQRTLRTMEPR